MQHMFYKSYYNDCVVCFFFHQRIYMGPRSRCPSLRLNGWHVTTAEREMNGHGWGESQVPASLIDLKQLQTLVDAPAAS